MKGKGEASLPLETDTRTYRPRRITLKAKMPVPIAASKASGASNVKEKAPPVSTSAEALLVAVAPGVAVALAEGLAVGLEVAATLQFLGCGSSLRTSSNGSANKSVGAINVV